MAQDNKWLTTLMFTVYSLMLPLVTIELAREVSALKIPTLKLPALNPYFVFLGGFLLALMAVYLIKVLRSKPASFEEHCKWLGGDVDWTISQPRRGKICGCADHKDNITHGLAMIFQHAEGAKFKKLAKEVKTLQGDEPNLSDSQLRDRLVGIRKLTVAALLGSNFPLQDKSASTSR